MSFEFEKEITFEEEQELHERAKLANARYEQRLKQNRERATQTSEQAQGQTAAPQADHPKNTISKQRKIQLRKYVIGGEGKQNANMLAQINSFVEFTPGKIVYVGCLPWVVVGEIPQRGERVEVTA